MVKTPMWHFSSVVTLKKTSSKEAPKKAPILKCAKESLQLECRGYKTYLCICHLANKIYGLEKNINSRLH